MESTLTTDQKISLIRMALQENSYGMLAKYISSTHQRFIGFDDVLFHGKDRDRIIAYLRGYPASKVARLCVGSYGILHGRNKRPIITSTCVGARSCWYSDRHEDYGRELFMSGGRNMSGVNASDLTLAHILFPASTPWGISVCSGPTGKTLNGENICDHACDLDLGFGGSRQPYATGFYRQGASVGIGSFYGSEPNLVAEISLCPRSTKISKDTLSFDRSIGTYNRLATGQEAHLELFLQEFKDYRRILVEMNVCEMAKSFMHDLAGCGDHNEPYWVQACRRWISEYAM